MRRKNKFLELSLHTLSHNELFLPRRLQIYMMRMIVVDGELASGYSLVNFIEGDRVCTRV